MPSYQSFEQVGDTIADLAESPLASALLSGGELERPLFEGFFDGNFNYEW